jgi:hypothetical protein
MLISGSPAYGALVGLGRTRWYVHRQSCPAAGVGGGQFGNGYVCAGVGQAQIDPSFPPHQHGPTGGTVGLGTGVRVGVAVTTTA